MASQTRKPDARRAFLTDLIDDAGLFPPARRPMDRAVACHAASRHGPHGWITGRFACPATRLGELADGLPTPTAGLPWRIAVLLDPSGSAWDAAVDREIEATREFVSRVGRAAEIEALETRWPNAIDDETQGLAAHTAARVLLQRLPAARLTVRCFLEPPSGEPPASVAGALQGVSRASSSPGASTDVGAKLRCGGLTADAYPDADAVAAFIVAARDVGLPIRATAGLHHPFRRWDRGIGVTQHGFVNVLGGAVLAAVCQLEVDELTALVADDDQRSFALTGSELRWRSRTATASAIADARETFVNGYASCSFGEPIEDLIDHGVLSEEFHGRRSHAQR